MKLFDAHCHLQDDRLFADLENIVARAGKSGVEKMICAGTSPADWNRVLECAQRFPHNIIPALGIHPWFVEGGTRPPGALQTLENLLIQNPAAAIGETGLDFQKRFTNREAQEKSFIAHLQLAGKLNRPVVVHCVHAWGRLFEIIKENPAPNILLHAYSGATELIPELAALNCCFSFNAGIINLHAKRVRAAIAAVPEHRLLLETDAPDFTPPGKTPPNEPANLNLILRVAAELRNQSESSLAEITFRNTAEFFKF
ncbi:MAG: TatD family hydrolase [Kiritimatiellales bacterium]